MELNLTQKVQNLRCLIRQGWGGLNLNVCLIQMVNLFLITGLVLPNHVTQKINISEYELKEMINKRIVRTPDNTFECSDCDYKTKHLHCLKIHIESKHIISDGFQCQLCEKLCPTRNALRAHQKRHHCL